MKPSFSDSLSAQYEKHIKAAESALYQPTERNNIMEVITKIIGAISLVVIVFFVIAIILAWPLMLLWNWLIPVLFPGAGIAHSITLIQAFGILLLSGFLFKSSSSSK